MQHPSDPPRSASIGPDAAPTGRPSPAEVLEMDEATWYARVYQGAGVPQLTLRSVAMGSLLGFLLAFTNLYVGLKTGWGLGVALTACILAYALSNALHAVGIWKTPMSILEMNCAQSTASAAGYSTGSTMVSAISALLMLSATPENPAGEHLPWPVLAGWTFVLAALGTVLAIPMKRSLVNRERLKFPSGTAAAVTLHSLYSEGREAMIKARALLGAAAVAALAPLLLELHVFHGKREEELGRGALLPSDSKVFDWLPARGVAADGKPFAPSDWTMVMDHNPVMIAAGMLVGLRVAAWMTVGGLLLAYVVGPMGWDAQWTSPVTGEVVRAASAPYKAWKEIGIWFGVPIMVSSGLLAFAMQWRTIVRAFQSLASGGGDEPEIVKQTEVPASWFVVGGLVASLGTLILGQVAFDIPWAYGVLAIALSFVLSLVAARATGESDITPIGAMGKITQLTYGVLIPQSTTANLTTASITASAAVSSADLLNDLKSGYLLGANPRQQFLAQLAGIFAGTVASVGGFYLLVPDATALLGVGETAPKFPAPAAQSWKAVAEVFKYGLENMHPLHQQAIFAGLLVGALLTAAEASLPAWRKWVPSATGLGLGLILPFQYPLSMLVGAILAELWTRASATSSERFLVPISAGIIAGVSLMGVLVAVINNLLLG
jgi:uncharacterized oligopeptide transporter (OPT) family protein